MQYKPFILTASMAVFLGAPLQAKEDLLTGDVRLACEALLCLSSGERPEECDPALKRFYSIKSKKPWKTLQRRKDFLNLCPASQEEGMPERVEAIANGAGKCDATYLNYYNTFTYKERICKENPWGGGRRSDRTTCTIITKTAVSNHLPNYCGDYINHEWTHELGVKYVGTPKEGGYWVSKKDYNEEVRKYNRKQRAKNK